MNNDWVWDVETFPNVFTAAFEHAHVPIRFAFEISDWRNDSKELIDFIYYLRSTGARLVGYNNINFDYAILHMLLKMGHSDAVTLYNKAMAIIGSQNDDDVNKWAHSVKPSDRVIEQIDLFNIWHFDNRAKATGLKALEFNMRSETIEDLPFPVGTVLNWDQMQVLKKYNAHDVAQTKLFYHHSKEMIAFREELTAKYSRDFMNHNDTKIGKDFFVMKLEEAGVACYEFGPEGRTPRQTKRPSIALKDCILPWITFEHPELDRVLNWLKERTITETKGVFKDLTARVKEFTFVFGLGGVHGSVKNEVVESDDEYVLIDLDVSSFYPNLAITNGFYPEHLGETFVHIYKHLYEMRKQYPKKSAESAMLKLALNGTFGDSNSPFSVFYDPNFTMSITLNGQFLLCKLAEMLMQIPTLRLIQANTDGVTVRVHRGNKTYIDTIAGIWQKQTGLTLEEAVYKSMAIRDVNNYLAVYKDGSVKRKGAYEWKTEWHQNASALVVPKVAEQVLVHGAPIRKTVEEWPDIMDFMIRVKVPRSGRLSVEYPDLGPVKIQNTSRYYVAKGGGKLIKWLPPLKHQTAWRQFNVESGRGVHVCNNLKDLTLPVDYSYYIAEVEKLCLGMRSSETKEVRDATFRQVCINRKRYTVEVE